MRLTSRRVAVFLLLVLLSVGFGFAFDGIATAVEKSRYPRPAAYREQIARAAEAAGIPEAAVLALVRAESDFDGGGQDADSGVGLFRLTPEQLRMICEDYLQESVPDAGLLYDPETNLRVGCAYLSALYGRYGIWESVFAAWYADVETVDSWIVDPDCLNEQGKLTKIPDNAVAKQVAAAIKTQKKYTELYYHG